MIHRTRVLRIVSAITVLLAAGGVLAPASAKVAALPLDELIREADFIGLVHVDRTSWHIPFVSDRVATATVIETWAGMPTPGVEFIASPTWTCDISDARRGETALVLLRHRNKPGPMEIVHSGRGRFPIEYDDQEPWVIYWPDVVLPGEVETRLGLTPDEPFIRRARLQSLRAEIARSMLAPKRQVSQCPSNPRLQQPAAADDATDGSRVMQGVGAAAAEPPRR